MNKIVKKLIQFLIEIAIATILIIGIKIFTNGMYLFGLPALEDIQSVSISCPSVTNEIKEASSQKDIELALDLTGFLKYNLFEKANGTEEPLITITYHLNDGTNESISANNTTVWWNGKSYAIKDEEAFVKLAKGIFFPEGFQTK